MNIFQKSKGFDAIVQAILAANEDTKAEDITAADVIEILNAAADANKGTDATAAIQQQLDTETARVAVLETELETANNRIAELEADLSGTAAEPPATIVSKGEAGGKEMTIAQFADKNKGDTQAILEQLKKEGLI
jgi:hypothetical protein